MLEHIAKTKVYCHVAVLVITYPMVVDATSSGSHLQFSVIIFAINHESPISIWVVVIAVKWEIIHSDHVKRTIIWQPFRVLRTLTGESSFQLCRLNIIADAIKRPDNQFVMNVYPRVPIVVDIPLT